MHNNLTGVLKILGGIVTVIGLLAALFLLVKGVQLMDSRYAGDTGIYFVIGALAMASFFGLLGAIGFGVAALLEDGRGSAEAHLLPHEKECPSCRTMIPLESLKCSHCENDFTQQDVADAILAKHRKEKMIERGMCPICEGALVPSIVIEDGSIGDWCPKCKKSLQKMLGRI